MQKERVVFLDYLRVVACFMVMAIHSCEPFYLGGEAPNITSIANRWDMFWITVTECLCRACVPLFATMILYGEEDTVWNDSRYAMAVGGLLVLVAVGVFLIVRACTVWGGFQMLLETGDYTRANKLENKRNEHIGGIYWGAVTVIYLGWRFGTMHWHQTWIVWPIAGVAYGLLIAILRAVRSRG